MLQSFETYKCSQCIITIYVLVYQCVIISSRVQLTFVGYDTSLALLITSTVMHSPVRQGVDETYITVGVKLVVYDKAERGLGAYLRRYLWVGSVMAKDA